MSARKIEPTGSSCTVGIFDSGVGGLNVMRLLMELRPGVSIIYLGDTARLPYGDKGEETIVRYARENSSFLLQLGIDLLVIACNTASAYAAEELTSYVKVPVIDAIGPAASAAARCSLGKVAILATRAMVRSDCYCKQIHQSMPSLELRSIACPLFVPLVEEGMERHPATKLIAEHYLDSLREWGVDTVVLGCTHYPFLRSFVEELLPGIMIVDSSEWCARAAARFCSPSDRLVGSPSHAIYVSDDNAHFRQVLHRLLPSSSYTLRVIGR